MRIARSALGPLTCAGAVATASVLAWAPAFLDLALAVALAISWCIWLEEHPTA
jgi:hypothetical protein